MENLSSDQLGKYEGILKRIEDEHEKRNQLKKEIHAVDNKIIATGLTLKKDLVKEKIFKVFVKVFESISDIYDQLFDKITTHLQIEKLLPYAGSKFYFFEVYVSKPFQDRIIRSNWLINISLRNRRKCLSRSLHLGRQATHPIYLLIPFEHSIEQSIVDVYITWPGVGKWPLLEISNIVVNISYHLHLYSELKIKSNFYFKTLNFFKLYNSKSIPTKLPIVKSKLSYYTDIQLFLQILIKNSYHKWDPRKESCFSSTEHTATAKGTVGLGNIVNIELDRNSNTLTLHGNVEEILHLKNYFLLEFNWKIYEVKKEVPKSVKVFQLIIPKLDELGRSKYLISLGWLLWTIKIH